MVSFDDQMRRAIERVDAEDATSASTIAAARAAASGDKPPVGLEDPLRIATRAVTAGLAPTIGAVLAPKDGATTEEALAAVYERVLGDVNFLGARFLFDGAARSDAVCRVVIRSASGSVAGYGTGFMVSPSVVMTNNHVLEAAATAGRSLVQFGYRERTGGTLHPVAEFQLEPDRLFITSVDLDFTLSAVAAVNPAGQRVASQRLVPLIGASGKSLKGERVNIIQHPSGEPQQVVIHDNLIVDLVDDFLRYVADTQPGSSGSPVFNNNWDLAALHHSGVPRTDDQGRILLTNGDVWDGSPAKRDLIDWVSNEGVRISSIVAYLHTQPASAELDTVLDPPASPEFESAGLAGAGNNGTIGPVVGPHISGSTARWQVPIEVELEVAGLEAPHTVVRPTPAASVEPAYFDEVADMHAANAYFTAIDPDTDPRAFYNQLHALSVRAHTGVLSYTEARLDHLYPNVDLHPDGKLHSVYSDIPFDPQEMVAADLEIEAQRASRLQQLLATETTLSTERVEELISALEAELMFNCEHVVPQSWFAKAQPMRADLHHLFTCESGCNSFRSNIAYWDFPPDLEAIRSECGQVQGRRFEPEAHHGAVARATLYFLIRYPGLIAPTDDEMPADRVPILLDWHRSEPPSLWERHRNASIAQVQGNRNPLIDHPDWGDQVDFALGLAQ